MSAKLLSMDLEKRSTVLDIQSLLTVREEVDRLFDTLDSAESPQPRADLFDLGESYQLVLEVPGVRQDALEVALQGDDLIVAGIREVVQSGMLLLSERVQGPFQRSLRLPGPVDYSASLAELRDGLLILTLPKA